MADPYAEIRKLADAEIKYHAPIQDPGDHGCWGCDANWPCETTRLARFVLAALPVVEAADHAVSVLGLEDSIDQLSRALANLEAMTRG